ncbi:MAG: GHKL domain-containing protein, partial [Bdellovibrionales bacterium]|nr:GHKL domain-containing protein [Bdellovibrionales bacterium]
EIKNPLTPIQLSAQRLERLLANTDFAPAVKESANTIVEYVDSIKRLANEFSQFARMPSVDLILSDLNLLLSETMSEFAENNPDIRFQFVAGNKMPNNNMDRDQIRRCFINIIDNAIAALRSDLNKENFHLAKISVRTAYDTIKQRVSFEVSDNGPGIADEAKIRIFEPYFTTSKNGTGLGLAIVRSIIDDHQAEIEVKDNSPTGAKFIVSLPIQPIPVTQRKLAGGIGEV